jgi:hypothetical protein
VPQSPGRRWLPAVVLLVVLLAYSAAVVAYQVPRQTIHNLDFWYHLTVGQRLQWNDPRTLVDGLYPLGYPFVLRLAAEWGFDALRVGQILSWGGGLLAIGALFLLVYSLTGSILIAVAGSVLLLTNGQFLYHATFEGNDLLAAGFQAAAILMLWYGLADRPTRRLKLWLALSGILLGFAYLARHTALLLLPIALFCTVLRYGRSRRDVVSAVALYSAGFLAVTAVQWVPSLIAYHNPFYNHHAKNVWFRIYGQRDYINNWRKVPDTISLRQVIALDPGRFFLHWVEQVRSALVTTMLWPWPLQIGWVLALPLLLFARQPGPSRRLLLVMVVAATIIGTAMVWVAPRFLLVPQWTEAALLAWLAFYLTRRLPLSKRSQLASAGGALLILAAVSQWQGVRDWLRTPPLVYPLEVNSFLRLAGMQDASRVATNDRYLHATDEPFRTRYALTYRVDASPSTVDELLERGPAADWEFLVMDYSSGQGNYQDMGEDFRQERARLAPLALSERRDIFCVLPCMASEAVPIDLTFGPGIHLVGYRLLETQNAGALYLYWRAERALGSSYKVSVRLKDEAGRVIFQKDNVPQLGTRPTTQWQPEALVVDFYSWQLDPDQDDYGVSILLYDEDSMELLTATTPGNETTGPLIDLLPASEK